MVTDFLQRLESEKYGKGNGNMQLFMVPTVFTYFFSYFEQTAVGHTVLH
jgi:hypothetical protein